MKLKTMFIILAIGHFIACTYHFSFGNISAGLGNFNAAIFAGLIAHLIKRLYP